MLLARDLVKTLRRGELFLDCFDMELKQNCETEPGLVRGPGYIKQNQNGGLEFKIYARDNENIDGQNHSSGKFRPGAGELYQHHHYYTLTAVDFWQNRWTAGRILPDFHRSAPYMFTTGKFFEMDSLRDGGVSRGDHYLDMAIHSKVEIPFNAGTEYFESIEGQQPMLRRATQNRAVFKAADCDFTITTEDDVVLISVQSSVPIPTGFETRIIEGLLFVLGRPLAWNESIRRHGRREHMRIRSRNSDWELMHVQPPIALHMDSQFKKVWVLFDLYLRFVGRTEGVDFHPCSMHLFSISQASANTVDSFALALAVAVEGLVKTLYRVPEEKTVPLNDFAEALKVHVLSWRNFDWWGARAGITRERLRGLIGNLKHVSPQDRMQLLVTSGHLVQEHVTTWKRVRRRRAHSLDDLASREMRDDVRENDILLTLVYHLIFNVIGYEGVYIDYSQVGYPPQVYPPSMPL